jgi:hypothetical protein
LIVESFGGGAVENHFGTGTLREYFIFLTELKSG